MQVGCQTVKCKKFCDKPLYSGTIYTGGLTSRIVPGSLSLRIAQCCCMITYDLPCNEHAGINVQIRRLSSTKKPEKFYVAYKHTKDTKLENKFVQHMHAHVRKHMHADAHVHN